MSALRVAARYFVLPAALMLLLSTRANATGPYPGLSSCSSCIVVSPRGDFDYVVTLKDYSGQPLSGYTVLLQTSPAPNIHLCNPSPPEGTYGFTDAAGRAIFRIKGGGSDTHNFNVLIPGGFGYYALCSPRPRSPDLNGDLVVNAADQALHAALPSNSLTGDYDCDGDTDAQDRALLDARLGHSCQLADVDPHPSDIGVQLEAYPNPSRGDVTLQFVARRQGWVSLRVEDLAGRAIRTLIAGTHPAGTYQLRWDGLADDGTQVGPGFYFYDLVVGDERRVQRAVVVR